MCVAALVGAGAGACVENGDPPWGEALDCMVTEDSGGGRDELVARMNAPGKPAETTWWRGGAPSVAWTFTYDGEQRLRAEEADFGDDGVPDQRRELVHAPDGVVESFVELRATPPLRMETARWSLRSGWVTGVVTPEAEQSFDLAGDGWIDVARREGVDVDTGQSFTAVDVYERSAEELLMRWTSSDTRGGATREITFVHDFDGDMHRIVLEGETAPPETYGYVSDAEGRLVHAAVDEDGDGRDNWTVDIAHAADRGVVVTSMRDGDTFRTHTYSAGCHMVFEEPWAPRAMARPGPRWMHLVPSIPSPY